MTDATPTDAAPPAPLMLLASADESFVAFATYLFDQLGLRVLPAEQVGQLRETLAARVPDILLVDARLPGLDLPALCAELRLARRTRSIAILVQLAGTEESAGEALLASGADECLARPLRPERLVACVRAALPGGGFPIDGARRQLLTYRDIELDLGAHLVRRNGRRIHLAPTEFRLLRQLMMNPHRVLSRHELQHAAWPPDIHIGGRTIDVHIGRLRQALMEAGGPDPFRTVRSVGYALSD